MSVGQLDSKAHLIEALAGVRRDLGEVLVIGGWLGVLPLLLLDSAVVSARRVISIDLDPSCEAAADELNRRDVIADWRFKAVTGDAMNLSYPDCTFATSRSDGSPVSIAYRPATVINTVWEHLPDPEAWFHALPDGLLVAIQASSNPDSDGHINPVGSLAALESSAPFSLPLYSGTMKLADSLRFTAIGVK